MMLFKAFEKIATSQSQNIALENEYGDELSYCRLYESVVSMAGLISKTGLCNHSRIGICAPKSLDVIISMLAVLKCGACYVPVESANPKKRNIKIFEDCSVDAVIIEKGTGRNIFDELDATLDIIELKSMNVELVALKRTKHDGEKFKPELVNILYTSGSTGAPKGVMCSEENVMAFLQWSRKELSISTNEKFLSIAPICFDLSILDIFLPLITGGTVVLADKKTTQSPRALASLISSKNITNVYTTPTLLKLLLNYGNLEKFDFSRLKRILFAGEVFPLPQFLQLKAKLGEIDYYNFYGPTETNVCCSYKVIIEELNKMKALPIGKPCSHYTYTLIDEDDNEISTDKVGELVIFGPVMSGYFGDTNQIINALEKNGKFGYRTGDLVNRGANGNLFYKGRKDRMVKRNGYRIEPAEIETVLALHTDLIDIAVVTKIDIDSSVRVYAYYICTKESIVNNVSMKSYSAKVLPAYMIPDQFVHLNKVPMNKNGKIAYEKLDADT
jgi:amino acid adenylation domain-containing protein